MTVPLTANTITTRNYDIDVEKILAILELRGKVTKVSLEEEKTPTGRWTYSYRPYISITTEEKIE